MPALAKMSPKALARLLVKRTPADVTIHADPLGKLMNNPGTRGKYSDAHFEASRTQGFLDPALRAVI